MDIYDVIYEQAQRGAKASCQLALLSTQKKNEALLAMAAALVARQEEILAANCEDLARGKAKGMPSAMLDRLALNEERIQGIASGITQVAALSDPIGEIISGRTLSNGLIMRKVRVPLGLIGIVYEARPNVTADAIALCLKSGNAVLLKGGSEALASNTAIVRIMEEAALAAGIPRGAMGLITSTEHRAVDILVTLKGLVDLVIPRGSARLIRTVCDKATVPFIETGAGICHTYVDESADVAMAVEICFNAKVQRPSVCNAMETLLVHAKVAGSFLPLMLKRYQEAHVRLVGDARTQSYGYGVGEATAEDWSTEYDDYVLSVKIVDSMEEAIEHIARYGTKHSECIVTESRERARIFQARVDASAVYVNASTRFTDGFEFGMGAEIGISTQKLHARGPMALPELTTIKYLIDGNGQIRS